MSLSSIKMATLDIYRDKVLVLENHFKCLMPDVSVVFCGVCTVWSFLLKIFMMLEYEKKI